MNKPINTHRSHPLATIGGATCAGIIEIVLFHPIDTIAKRLMSNTNQHLNITQIIFRQQQSQQHTYLSRYKSLFPGIGFAAGFKILQRVYKYGGQPVVLDMLDRSSSTEWFERRLGKENSKPMLHALSGSIIGIGEVVLLPLDILKIKAQTNPQSIAGRGIVQILAEERLSSLYRGMLWTMIRNAPGSFALFGANALVKDRVFKLENYSDATFFQNFVSSCAGGFVSITISSPPDVIKTRLQNASFQSGETGCQIVWNLLKHEGVLGFFKGLTPKLLIVGPKLVFSFTIAQTMISWFHSMMTNKI